MKNFLELQKELNLSNKQKGQDLKKVLGLSPEDSLGELSDGYHTFNELYHHRAILFACLCNKYKTKSWKSKLHHDGTMYDNMFIVGMDTPKGQISYHYDIDPYWDIFKVKERKKAPEWDGHTADDVIIRLLSLLE